MNTRSKSTIAIASALAALLFAVPATSADPAAGTAAHVQLAQMRGGGPGYGYGYGMGPGYGMMGPGYGMMGPGYGYGMMGPGYGYGMMGPGYGYGMMGRGYGMGPGRFMRHRHGRDDDDHPCAGNASFDRDLGVDDVRKIIEGRLARRGNDRLKVGNVAEKDADTITAEIVTVDNSLVDRFEVDRHTGRFQRVK